MYEMVSIGTKTLIHSNNLAIEGEDEKISASELFWIITISVLFTLGFFVFLPYLLTVLAGFNEQARPVLFNIVDAVIKLAFFIAYVAVIARMKDIKRVFQYHGAEHMVVHCYEAKKALNVKNVKKYETIHPRCGSSFVMITIAISIIVFSLLPLAIKLWTPGFFNINFALQKTALAVLRILVLPIIIALSYELLKLAGKYPKNILLQAVSYPGLLLQKMTTSKPDSKQIEVAIAAIKKLI